MTDLSVPGDVGSKAGCKKLYEDVAAQTKVVSNSAVNGAGADIQVDVLVNCAGVMKNYKNPTDQPNNSELSCSGQANISRRGRQDDVGRLRGRGL